MIKNGFSMIFNWKSLNDSSPFFQAVLFQIVQELVSLRHDLLDFHSFSMQVMHLRSYLEHQESLKPNEVLLGGLLTVDGAPGPCGPWPLEPCRRVVVKLCGRMVWSNPTAWHTRLMPGCTWWLDALGLEFRSSVKIFVL